MKHNSTTPLALLLYCLLAYFLMVLPAVGQTNEEGPWWPHQLWGPGDQAGGSNWITPEKVLEVLSLVKTGKIYELGHIYEPDMPLLGQGIYKLVIPGSPTGGSSTSKICPSRI